MSNKLEEQARALRELIDSATTDADGKRLPDHVPALIDVGDLRAVKIALSLPLIETWETIETAPKDGTKFDAWVPSRFGGYRMPDLSFNSRGQLRQHGLLTAADLPHWPTHWRRPPSPPAIRNLSTSLVGEGEKC